MYKESPKGAFTEEDDSEFDHGDEFEESIGTSTERRNRQSIAEMVTLHKLNTATPISAKLHSRLGKPVDIEISGGSSSYDE